MATRPIEWNGLGMTPARAAMFLGRINRNFPILETPDIHQEWQRPVVEHRVSAKKAHDTRLVAAMSVHGVKRILTFNVDDFKSITEITTIHPAGI